MEIRIKVDNLDDNQTVKSAMKDIINSMSAVTVQHILNAESNINATQSKIAQAKKEIDELHIRILEKMKYIQALEAGLAKDELRFQTALAVAMQICPEKIVERWKSL